MEGRIEQLGWELGKLKPFFIIILLWYATVFYDCAGFRLKVLVDSAENYHAVLAENKKLYNEVQELKGIYLIWKMRNQYCLTL